MPSSDIKGTGREGMSMEVSSIVRQALASTLNYSLAHIDDDTRLLDIGLDSLRLMDVLLAFENGIAAEIPKSALGKIADAETVGELVALLRGVLATRTLKPLELTKVQAP